MNLALPGRHRAPGSGDPGESAAGPWDEASVLLALAVQVIGEELDPDVVFQQTLELACAVTAAGHGMLSVRDESGEVVQVLSHGEIPEAGPGSGLATPIVVEGEQVGTLHLGGREAPFRGVDAQLVGILTRAAATALRHARSVSDRIAGDRARIARDLHDLVGQRLYAAGLVLQGARAAHGLPEPVSARIGATVRDLDTAIRDLRATVLELRLPPGSLPEQVRELSAEYAGVLGFEPRVAISGPVAAVAPHVADQLLLALRESLSNVARHASAGRVEVEVAASAQWLLLGVADDGVGLPLPIRSSGGLANLRARAESLGGVLRVARCMPGTRLDWIVPSGVPSPES